MKTLKKAFSILLVCSLLLTAIPAFAESTLPEKGGVMFGGYAVHDFAENDYNKFITFSGDQPGQIEVQSFCLTTYAAAYYNGVVYGYLYGYDQEGTLHDEFYTMNTLTGYMIDFPGGNAGGEFVYAMAYNYADDTMYALCDEDHPYIASVDLATGELTRFVDINLGSFLGLRGMAINADGVFYLLTMSAVNSRLLTLNMETGALTEIGATGKPAYYAQSMTCDPATGRLYWAQLETYTNNGLFEIDPATAACTSMGKIGVEGMEITGLYVVFDQDEPDYLLGDINDNGEIDMQDALMALRASMQLVELTERQTLAGDVNLDGSVTTTDALRIMRLVMGLIDEL